MAAGSADPEAEHALRALVELLLAFLFGTSTNLLGGSLHKVETGSRGDSTTLKSLYRARTDSCEGVFGAGPA